MKKIITILCIIYFFLPNNSYSKFSDSFFSDSKSGIIYTNFAYNHELNSNIMSNGKGLAIDFGFNVGWFFNKSLIIAPFGGISPLWGNSYNSNFIEDFSNNFIIPEKYDQLNSNVSYLNENEYMELRSLQLGLDHTDGIKSKKLDGALNFSYGVLLKLPYRVFPPVKIYKLFYFSKYKKGVTHYYVGPSKKNYTWLNRSGWGVELLLFRGKILNLNSSMGTFNIGTISVYYESLDFMNSTLVREDKDAEYTAEAQRAVYLYEFTKENFKSDYKQEWRIGLKIGITLL